MTTKELKKVFAQIKEKTPEIYETFIREEHNKLTTKEARLSQEEYTELLTYFMHKAKNRIKTKPELGNALRKIPNLLIENSNNLIHQ